MEKISKTVKNPFVLAIALNLVFLLAYLILGSCRFASMDDFFMSSILSGTYGGEYDVHLYFVKVIYGLILKPFYYLFPSVGWYYVFEIIEVFASFVVLVYALLSRLGLKNGAFFSLFLLCCLSPIFYFDVDFTKNAAILTAVGFLLLFMGGRQNFKFLLLGIAYACMGFVMRSDAFYLGLPCLAVLIVFRWVSEKRVPVPNVVAIAACILINVGVSHFDKTFYQDDDYKYYASYQGPRAVFGDGRYYDYDAALDEIEERNLHGIDFEMMTKWTFYDTEVLAKDSLYKFINVINHNRHEIIVSKVPVAVLKELSRCLHEIPSWYWIFLCFIAAYCGKGLCRFLPWVSLGYVTCAYVYLLLLNRVVSHVEMSIWLYASVLLISILKKEDVDKVKLSANMKRSLWVMTFLLYAIGFWGMGDYVKAEVFRSSRDERWEAFMQYEKDNADKLFFMDLTAYKRFCARLGGSYRALEPGRLNHIIPLGYWNVHLPSIKKNLREQGIENPMRAITNPNVLVVNYDKASKYEEFLKLHYGYDVLSKNLLWSKVPGKEFLSFDVTQFYIKEDKFEK